MNRALMAAVAFVVLPTAAAMAQSVTPGNNTTAQTKTAPTATLDTTVGYIARQPADQTLVSSLIGTSVRGLAEEAIGDVNDFLITKDGKVDAVVIGVGGFLGVGEKNVAVPFSAVLAGIDPKNPNKPTMVIATTKEALRAAPDFVKAAASVQGRNTPTGATGSGGPRPPVTPTAPQ